MFNFCLCQVETSTNKILLRTVKNSVRSDETQKLPVGLKKRFCHFLSTFFTDKIPLNLNPKFHKNVVTRKHRSEVLQTLYSFLWKNDLKSGTQHVTSCANCLVELSKEENDNN